MNRFKQAAMVAAATIALNAFTAPLMAASIGIGISGAWTDLDTSGTETLKTTSVVSSTSRDTVVNVPSMFIQITGPWGIVLGIEHVPLTAELGSEFTSRVDKLKGGADAETSVDQIVQAEVSDHNTVYIETPGYGFGGGSGVYLMAGYSSFDVLTNEKLGTGAAYGDASIDGTTLGIGIKTNTDHGFFAKLLGTWTDYDSISLTSTGSDAASTITADIDATAAKFSLGYNF